MTDKAMDQVRAEFEAAMAEDLAICNPVFCDRKNTYKDYDIHCAWVMWLAAKEKYEPKREAEFVRHMFTEVWPESGIDGGELEELGERFGFLKTVDATESCGEGCVCALYESFPMTCYRLNLDDAHPEGE